MNNKSKKNISSVIKNNIYLSPDRTWPPKYVYATLPTVIIGREKWGGGNHLGGAAIFESTTVGENSIFEHRFTKGLSK